MPIGLSQKLGILSQSPHDLAPVAAEAAAEKRERWIPSRYTVRATTEDGRLVLWNTLSGAMSVFSVEQRPVIESMLSRKGFEYSDKGLVRHLRRRGFLMRADADEMRQLRLKFGQQHYRNDLLQLILLSSEDCNFRCTYCYEKFARGTMEPWVRTGIKKLVEKRIGGLKALTTSWFGGEPLYGWEAIEELAPFMLETAKKHGVYYLSNMTTNGYLLVPEVAEKLLAWKINRFQITLDGPPETHNCSRPARDGSETFATILENLVELHKRPEPFNVALRINFDRENASLLREFLGTIEETFERDPRFSLRMRAVGKWGSPNDVDLDVCSDQDEDRVRRELAQEAERRGLVLSDTLLDYKSFGSQVCYAARPYNFIVGANGNLMKCTVDLDQKERNRVGTLTPEGDLDLDHDRLAKWTEPAFENDKQCKKCVVLPSCQGMHCPQYRFDTDTPPCTPLRSRFKEEMIAVTRSEAPAEGFKSAETGEVKKTSAGELSA